MALTMTAKRKALTESVISALEAIFEEKGVEFDHTGESDNTLTFVAGVIDNEEVYGSIKFTLHKPDFDLEGAIYDHEVVKEDRAAREAEKARKAEAKAKAKEERERKSKERAALKAKEQAERTAKLEAE